MKRGGSIASGVVLFILGVMVILRTVTHDDQGDNLVDKVLGLGGSPASSTPAGGAQATSVPPGPVKQYFQQQRAGKIPDLIPPSSKRNKVQPHRATQKARR